MRRVLLLVPLALAVCGAVSPLTVDPAAAHRHAQAVRATYPRPEASRGESELIEYLVRTAETGGLEPRIIDFSGYAAGHSFSRLVEIVVPGDIASTVFIIAPLNHPDGASPDDDRSASVAAALTVMEAIAAQGRVARLPTVRFLFAGAEYGDAEDYPRGTNRFLADYFAEGPHALIYLDVSRMPPFIETGGGGRVSPDWLVERTADAARTAGTQARSSVGLNQLHRLGISDAPQALTEFLRAGIPAVYLRSTAEGRMPPEVGAVTAQLSQLTAAWTASFATGVPDTWDRHYLAFRLGRRSIVIGETGFLLILLVLLMSTTLYALLFRRLLSRYLRTILRNLWNLPVLFLLIFGFFSAGTYLLEFSVAARRFPDIWQWYPSTYFGLKIALACFLFSVAAQLFRHLPISRNGSFYSAAALFVLFLDIVIFSVVNLSFASYFIWAFFWAFIFSITRFRLVKALALVLSPLLLFGVTVEVFRVPELRLAGELLRTTRGDLILSFAILPFLLMLIRLDFLVRHPVRGRRSFALRSVSLVSGVLVGGMLVYVLLSTPFSQSNPQPVKAVETVDYPALERSLRIESPAPIGEIRVLFAGQEQTVHVPGREHTINSPRLPDVISVRLTYEDFLERDRARLVIDAPQHIDDLRIQLTSERPMVIYDVSYPFTIAPDRRSATISVGRRPPLPLTVDFTVARGTSPSVEIVAESPSHPEPIAIVGRQLDVESRLVIRTRLDP